MARTYRNPSPSSDKAARPVVETKDGTGAAVDIRDDAEAKEKAAPVPSPSGARKNADKPRKGNSPDQ